VKRFALWGGMLVVLAVCGGCNSGSADDVMKDTVSTMNEMADVLDTIKDQESAKAARPKLENLLQRLKDLKAKADKIKVTKSEEERLKKKYEPDLKKIHDRFFQAGLNLQRTGTINEVKDIFEQMQRLGAN